MYKVHVYSCEVNEFCQYHKFLSLHKVNLLDGGIEVGECKLMAKYVSNI